MIIVNYFLIMVILLYEDKDFHHHLTMNDQNWIYVYDCLEMYHVQYEILDMFVDHLLPYDIYNSTSKKIFIIVFKSKQTNKHKELNFVSFFYILPFLVHICTKCVDYEKENICFSFCILQIVVFHNQIWTLSWKGIWIISRIIKSKTQWLITILNVYVIH